MSRLQLNSRPELKRTLYSLVLPDNRLVFAFTPQEVVVLPPPSRLQKELLLLLDGSRTVAEIGEVLADKGIDCGERAVLDELDRLDEHLLLEDKVSPIPSPLSADERDRYDRQLLFFAAREKRGTAFSLDAQERLKRAHVVLMGLGGYGSHIFYGLATLGIGTLTLVDYDRVEVSNLNRQILYDEADLGLRKTDAVREKAPRFNRHLQYHCVNRRIDALEDIMELMQGADLLVLAADTPRDKIFDWTNEAAYRTGVPVLFSQGVGASHIFMGPLVVPGRTACFRCARPPIQCQEDDPLASFINGRVRHGVIAPYLMMAGGVAALEILRHLTGIEPCRLYDRKLTIDVGRYQMGVEPVERRADCPYCGGSDPGKQNVEC